MQQRRVLTYQPVRESDIFWEKRIWRIIDVREKMNLPFAYPEEPFFKLLADAATKGDLPVYAIDGTDKFNKRMSTDDVLSMLSKTDTVVTFDPETYEEKVQIVRNDINWEDVKRFRLKEVWFFDKETSTLQVRILGIAPLIDVKDNEGNFRFEKPMFWVYYPHARELFARHRVFTMGGNTNATISWEDLFEMRFRHFLHGILNFLKLFPQVFFGGIRSQILMQCLVGFPHTFTGLHQVFLSFLMDSLDLGLLIFS